MDTDRLLRRLRRLHERVCRLDRGRLAPAADLSPRRGSRARLDARRSAAPVRFRARVDHGARQAALHGADRGRAHALPMPMAERTAYSTDGRQLTYTPYFIMATENQTR
jgi:hypothetical protein